MARRWFAVPTLLLAVLGGLAAAGDEPRRQAKRPVELETIDQPPAKESARDNVSARSPGVRVATGPYVSVQVNVDALGHNIVGDAANEPSLAVNPLNPSNMVVGWRQFNSVTSNFRQAGWAYTFNKGQTWTFPGVLTPGTFRSDPSLDVDSSGIFFYESLKSDFTMDVFRSVDGGVTWGFPVSALGGDKNWLVVDRTGGPSDGALYGIWQRFSACCGTNVLTRSTDGGQSFEGPWPVERSPTFGTMAVGPDGTLFAAGIDGTEGQDFYHFVLARSTTPLDPELTPAFVGDQVALGGYMDFQDQPNPAGLLGQANVATDLSQGGTRGNVYYMASVLPQGGLDAMDVHFARSVNGGRSFAPWVRVNDDPNGSWQWLAAESVAGNGRIDAIWFDTRESGFPNISRLYYAYSWDAGVTWSPNTAVSPPFNSWTGWPQQNKMGDYSGIVADATGADVAYAATFNFEQDVYYVRLFPDCNGNGVSDVTDLAAHTSQDCNASHVPDECENAPSCVGAGAVAGSLTVAKGAGGDLALSWGPSCSANDADYAVYEGSFGNFTSHAPRACTTAGARSYVLAPPAGDSYYLVVPLHADREGSYGVDGSGAERPPGGGACAPQTIHACGP